MLLRDCSILSSTTISIVETIRSQYIDNSIFWISTTEKEQSKNPLGKVHQQLATPSVVNFFSECIPHQILDFATPRVGSGHVVIGTDIDINGSLHLITNQIFIVAQSCQHGLRDTGSCQIVDSSWRHTLNVGIFLQVAVHQGSSEKLLKDCVYGLRQFEQWIRPPRNHFVIVSNRIGKISGIDFAIGRLLTPFVLPCRCSSSGTQ